MIRGNYFLSEPHLHARESSRDNLASMPDPFFENEIYSFSQRMQVKTDFRSKKTLLPSLTDLLLLAALLRGAA